MIQSLILEYFFENIISSIFDFFILVNTFQWISSCFFKYRFSSRNSQSKQKLAKKITHFTTQFRSKNLTRFRNLNLLVNENTGLQIF